MEEAEEDIYANLPDHPESAFIYLERHFRLTLNDHLERSDGQSDSAFYIQYINRTIAAARALNLDMLNSWGTPAHNDNVYAAYREFSSDIENFVVQIKIRDARRKKRYSVALDASAKQKIRHFIDQIRITVDALEVTERKRDKLHSKLSALQEEVDKARTGYESYADLAIEVADTAGDIAERLEPVRKWMESIGKVFGKAKDDEAPLLTAPGERKRLEAPRTDKFSDSPDDIPF